MKAPTIDEIMQDVTLTVAIKMPIRFRFRMAIAVFLIRLAARILGCKLALEAECN